MADNIETPRVLDEITRANGAQVRDKAGRTRLGSLLRMLVIMLLTVSLLVILAGLAWFQWNLQLRYNRLATTNTRLQDRVEAGNERIAGLEAQLNNAALSTAVDEALIQSLRDEFSGRLQQVNGGLVRLQNQLPRSLEEQDGRWRLAEADHLLRIASQHLSLTGDVATAISLLETADRLLVESGDERVAPGREALAAELEQLQAIADFDPERVYQRIGRLRQTLNQADLAPTLQEVYLDRLAGTAETDPDNQTQTAESSLGDRMLGYLRSLFILRQWPGRPDIVQPPDRLYYAREEIDLLLQQSQLALISRRRALFQDSLRQARDLTERYREALGDSTPQLQQELDSLISEDTFPELPELSQAAELIRPLAPGPVILPGPSDVQ
ncbi:MAG: uroporphyrinogen-III C-methyltransferase [Gammaproteobacteria bacterium]|nr:uroporphyrinogen-III C-methyltransferase [Pseudomonadales bacterium]MCP5347504.1 uroporphyrinogen-III C-methyltransferase [Pseudomonadales bacterium]